MGLRSWIRSFATPTGDLMEPKGGVAGSDQESAYVDIWAATSEANPIFRGRLRWMQLNEMRTDSMIRAILWLYKLPLRSAVCDVAPAGEGKDPTDRAVAEAAKWQFGLGDEIGRMSLSWDEWLTQRLLCLDWGSVFEEIVWAKEIDWWRDPTSGELRPIRPIARMGLRRPSSIAKIQWDEETGAITRILQDVPGVSEQGIPGDKLAHYAIERDGEFDWMGTSLLRAMYGPYRMKRPIMLSSAIAWDRWASGIPEVRYPQGGGSEKERRAERIGEHLRSHERGYVAFENGPQETGWDLKIHTATPADPVGILRYYDEQMSAAGLTMFSRLGVTETGSRAVGDTLSDPYYLAVQAVGKQIMLDSSRDVLRRFVDVNFGTGIDTPLFTIRKIRSNAVTTVVNVLTLLSGAGANVLTPETVNDVLQMLDLDELPDDVEIGAPREGDEAIPGLRRAQTVVRERIGGLNGRV